MDFHECLSCLLDNLERASSPRHAGHGSLGQSGRTDKTLSAGLVVSLLRHACWHSLRSARLPAKANSYLRPLLARLHFPVVRVSPILSSITSSVRLPQIEHLHEFIAREGCLRVQCCEPCHGVMICWPLHSQQKMRRELALL